MSRRIFVHRLPDRFEPAELCDGIAVVIDVLRASTTIVHALAAGARAVVACEEVADARRLAARAEPESIVLGGERGGVLIDGFDLDNSPLHYTPETVGGKIVVMTTTNGTRALLRCRLASRVFVGAFVNFRALTRMLAASNRHVHLVCAGTRGEPTSEDELCAGAIAARLAEQAGFDASGDDEARVARDEFIEHARSPAALRTALRSSRGGRDLIELGFDDDIDCAARWDRFDLVPEYSPRAGRIEPAAADLRQHGQCGGPATRSAHGGHAD